MIGFLTFILHPSAVAAEVINGTEAEGVAPQAGKDGLVPRVAPTKPAQTIIGPGVYPDKVVVKFREGSVVRLRGAGLVNSGAGNLSPAIDLLLRFPGVKVERLFSRPETALEEERVRGQSLSGKQLADLNNYYMIMLPAGIAASEFIDALNAMDIVEIAYPEPIAEPAAIEPAHIPSDIAPATPDYSAGQGYLNAAPAGVDATYAWTQIGGRGQGVQFADVEGAWKIGHEDLDIHIADNLSGDMINDLGWRNHGTAVLGEVVGYNNAYGIKGIANGISRTMMSSINSQSTASAINLAAVNLNAGDILLIELHAPGPDSGLVCECNCGQFEYIAMEYWQANFDAIAAATANGVIVVEAAGNGSMNLDNAIYGGNFDRSVRDSGAIVVAASTSGVPHNPQCWTNYGHRIDSYGWGENVRTTGYGDLFNGGGDENQYYTNFFSGTSSASPIVVGSAASLQGNVKSLTGGVLSPLAMREFLTGTGTTQGFGGTWGYKHISTMPDLKKAMAFMSNKADFDTVNAPCFFSQTTALRNELRKLGIKFKGNTTLNGGAILNECGNFGVTGQSSPNFLAFNCNALLSDGGTPKLPETIIFSSPYPQNVNLKIGSSSDAGDVVKLTAKDSLGNTVDTANVTLSSGLQSVTLSASEIKKIKLTGKAACVAVVDDIYFGGCMTGQYTDNFGIVYYLSEDQNGNISGETATSCDNTPWVVSGNRVGTSVTLKVTNPALDSCCFAYTFTATVDASCNSASGTWVNGDGICAGSGSMTMSRSGLTAPLDAVQDGAGPMSCKQ
jgi:hypothetical protein